MRALCPGQVYVIDGAMATELERRGADLDHDLWSARILVQQPELIEQVHLDYFRAGADIAITASYQATFAGFAAFGLDDGETRALLLDSVTLARQARERYIEETAPTESPELLVAAAIGPLAHTAMTVQNTAATTRFRQRSCVIFTAVNWKCWPGQRRICWPSKPSPAWLRVRRSFACSRNSPNCVPG